MLADAIMKTCSSLRKLKSKKGAPHINYEDTRAVLRLCGKHIDDCMEANELKETEAYDDRTKMSDMYFNVREVERLCANYGSHILILEAD